MKLYKVVISPDALADLEAIYLYLRDRTPLHADRWYHAFFDAILSLEHMPARCGLAPESDRFDEEIRQLLHGRRPHVYSVVRDSRQFS